MVALCIAGSIRGPFFRMSDPDYAYLLNSLNIVNGHPPAHVDHPGTPVQLFGALVIWLAHQVSGESDVTRDVLLRPEHYLSVIVAGAAVLLFLALLCCGWQIWRATGRLGLGVLAQTAFFASPVLAVNACRFMPEPFMILLALVLSTALICAPVPSLSRLRAWGFAACIAALCGCGLAAKITFLPLALVPLLVLRGVIPRLIFGGSTVAWFVVCTLPIRDRYAQFWGWVVNLATHQGRYGHGEPGGLSLPAFCADFRKLAASETVFLALFLLGGALLGIALWHARARRSHDYRVLAAFWAACAIQFVMVAKHPGDSRYLIPSLALGGAMLVAIHALAARMEWAWLHASLRAATVLVLLGAADHYHAFDVRRYIQQSGTPTTQRGALVDFADYWSGSRYTETLRTLYPNEASTPAKTVPAK